MTGIDEILERRADDAAPPPPDLPDRVERGFRLRRRQHMTAAAGAALVVVLIAAGSWAALRPPVGPDHPDDDLPAGPPPSGPVANAPLHLPLSLNGLPPVTTALPGTYHLDNITGPGGEAVDVAGRLDPEHLLVVGPTSFYSYRLADRTATPLVTGTTFQRKNDKAQVALSPRWILWAGSAIDDRVPIYRVLRTGGRPQAIAAVSTTGVGSRWYATDDSLFWTNVTVEGLSTFHWSVGQLSLTTGLLSHPAGLAGMLTDGTAWAWRPSNPARDGNPALLWNLITGESRPVAAAAPSNDMWCTPSFCFGEYSGGRVYVRHLDGTGLVTVAAPSRNSSPTPNIHPNAAGGLLSWGKRDHRPAHRAGRRPARHLGRRLLRLRHGERSAVLRLGPSGRAVPPRERHRHPALRLLTSRSGR